MTTCCRTCRHPTDDPDGQHAHCREHEQERVVAAPCETCGSPTSVRVAVTETPTCSWCLRAEAHGEAPVKYKPPEAPPPGTTGNAVSDALDAWVRA